MKKVLALTIFLSATILSLSAQEILIKFESSTGECGYLDCNKDTVIHTGSYKMCFTDTARYFATVFTHENRLIAIDSSQKELFEVFRFDNGPDDISEGLFRIIKNGLIGFANEKGEVVIHPRFKCAFPFKNGRAKVALECEKVSEREHTRLTSKKWFFIDRDGNKIKQ